MKLIFTFLLTLFLTFVNAQIPEGIYNSSKSSYRTDYFLKVEKDSITILGWETSKSGDTIYYKSTCKNDKSNHIELTTFHFSTVKNTVNSFDTFKPISKIDMGKFLMYKYFDILNVGGKVTTRAIKEIYFSRADTFEFVKVK